MDFAEHVPKVSSVAAWYRSRRGWAFVAAAWAVPFLLHLLLPNTRLNPAVPVLQQASWILGLWTAWGWWLVLLHPAFQSNGNAMGLRAVLIMAGFLLSAALCFVTFWLGSGLTSDQLVPNGPRLSRMQTLGTVQRKVSVFASGPATCEGPALVSLGILVTELALDFDTCNGYETFGRTRTGSMAYEDRPDLGLIALKATCQGGEGYREPCFLKLWRREGRFGLAEVPLGLDAAGPTQGSHWSADRDAKIRKLLGAPAAQP